jgi:cytoskeletal protein RodZ
VTPDTKPLPKQRKRSPHLVPWIVVGLIIVIALVVSTLVVKGLRADDSDTAGNNDKSQSSTQKVPSDKNSDTSGDDKSDDDSKKEDEKKNQVPEVTVGQTTQLNITQWSIQVDVSQKLGAVWYSLEGDPPSAFLTSSLIDQLPEQCAQMRSQFGFIKHSDGSLDVMKPDKTCQADPQLYNEIWGLLDAAANTARPM